MEAEAKRIKAMIAEAEHIAVLSHERPDGDAVGALLASVLALESAGHTVEGVLIEGIPRRFHFLPGAAAVVKTIPIDADLLFVVDCSDEKRTGFPPEAFRHPIAVNIDHHPTNTKFASINIVDPSAASTTEILAELLPALDVAIDADMATNLLIGMVTDTLGFRTRSVSPELLMRAADMLRLGAPLAEIYERALVERSFVGARYWGLGLARMQREDGLLWTSLTLEDRRQVGYPGSDDADLINLLTTVQGASVSVIFIEQPEHKVKISWRSRSGLDVASIAEAFGGGGHQAAAGAMVEGGLEEVQQKVLQVTRSKLRALAESDT